MNEAEGIRRRREQIRREFGSLYDRVSAILFEADPIGINFEDNTDEYEPEVDTILPKLKACRSVEDVRALIHEECVRWFDARTAGPPEKYQQVAQRIWAELRTRESN